MNKLHILAAYPYMNDKMISLIKEHKQDIMFTLDSGAFTAWKANKEIKLDDYCKYIESLPFMPDHYFMLDVIGDPHKTLKNYEMMLSRGFKPVPIFTRGEDISILEDYFKTSDVVGIGGLVGTPGNKGFVKGIMQHVKNRKVHWLGFTSLDYVQALRPYSIDSSGWATGIRFGALKLYSFSKRKFITVQRKNLKEPSTKNLLSIESSYYGESLKDILDNADWYNSGRNETILEKLCYKTGVAGSLVVTKHWKTKFFLATSAEGEIKGCIDAYNYWRNLI